MGLPAPQVREIVLGWLIYLKIKSLCQMLHFDIWRLLLNIVISIKKQGKYSLSKENEKSLYIFKLLYIINKWQMLSIKQTSVHPETASFGPILRSRIFSILDVDALRLRSKKSCGLVLNQNLLFLDGHKLVYPDTVFH